MAQLLNNVSENTVGEPQKEYKPFVTVYVYADSFGGGTVKIEASHDNQTFIPLSGASFTENSVMVIGRVGSGAYLKATLSGATNPSNVNVVTI